MADRETSDLYLGHPGFADDDRPRPAEGVDRYVVQVVYLDGVERVHSRHDALTAALEERDREIESHERDGYDRTRVSLTVYDSDDPERGWLDWGDE